MIKNKTEILDKICYTELVYDRINKKLNSKYSKDEIERMLFDIIKKTNETYFKKKGKNFYVTNIENNIRITINSNTYRVITVDVVEKSKRKNEPLDRVGKGNFNSSLTFLETKIASGIPIDSILEATLTLLPKTLSPSVTTVPLWIPMRTGTLGGWSIFNHGPTKQMGKLPLILTILSCQPDPHHKELFYPTHQQQL